MVSYIPCAQRNAGAHGWTLRGRGERIPMEPGTCVGWARPGNEGAAPELPQIPSRGLNNSLQGLQGRAWGSQPKAERCRQEKEFNSGFLGKGGEGNKNKVEFLHL